MKLVYNFNYYLFITKFIAVIRLATNDDFDFIYELYMHPQNNPYLLYEEMLASSFRPIFDELQSKNHLYIYEVDGIQTGMCKLIPLQHRTSHIVYLGGFAIHPFFAGKGEGLKMMQEILDYTKQKGFLRVELSVAVTNEKAIRLYQKAGFVKEGILKKYSYMKSEDRFVDEMIMACLL